MWSSVKLKNFEHKLTYSYASNDFAKQHEYGYLKSGSGSYLFNYQRAVRGHDWGFVVLPRYSSKNFSLSFRSLPGIVDLSLIAGEFGGGGHKLAAGADIQRDPNTTDVKDVLAEILEKLESLDMSQYYNRDA